SVDRDISDTYFNKMCQRIKAMNYSGIIVLFFLLLLIGRFILIHYSPLPIIKEKTGSGCSNYMLRKKNP
ncbi:hypothetical protein CYQ82_11780, partial [Enterococcus faecium]